MGGTNPIPMDTPMEEKYSLSVLLMGIRRGGDKTGICPPWKLGLRSKNLWNTWNQHFNSDYLG